MKHLGTIQIVTKRLILRRFTLDDVQAMYSNWASDPKVTKYLMWRPHSDMEVSRKVLEEWTGNYVKDDFYQWAIEYEGQPVGTISVVDHDDRVQMVHIGYCIGTKWWHKGIMSEALRAVITFFFEEIGVNRVESRHDPRNPHSGGVMKKCGMQFEGTLRQSDWNNQGICDASWYGILRNEWEAMQK